MFRNSFSAATFILSISVLCDFALRPSDCHGDTLVKLEQTTERLDAWLDSSKQGPDWRTYLDITTLQNQLVLGYDANPAKLKSVLARFKSNASGLDHPMFVSVQNALAAHIDALTVAKTTAEKKSDFANALKEMRVSEYSENRIVESRNSCLSALRLLKAYYQQTRPANEAQQIVDALGLDALIDAVSADLDFGAERGSDSEKQLIASISKLNNLNVFAKGSEEFEKVGNQLDDPFFVHAKEEIRNYGRFVFNNYRLRNERTRTALETSIEKEKTWILEKFSQLENNRRPAPRIAARLYDANQEDLLAALRMQYSKPNLFVRVSEDLANKFGSQPVSDASPLNEFILGRQIYGDSFTSGSVSIDFVDNPRLAHISIRLRGQVNSDSYTQEGRITAFSNSFAEIEARRSLVASINKVKAYSPYVAANLHSNFQGTSSRFRIVNRIANRLFLKDKLSFEKVGAFRAEQKLERQFSEQTDEILADAQEKLIDGRIELRTKLAKAQVDFRETVVSAFEGDRKQQGYAHANQMRIKVPPISVRTTDDSLIVSSRMSNADQIASTSNPPATLIKADIIVQMHESFAGNYLSNFVKDERYFSRDIPKLVEAFAPEPDDVAFEMDESKPWRLRFAKGRPIEVLFDKDEITVAISTSEFRAGDNRAPVRVEQKFALLRDKGLWLKTVGKPVVSILKDTQLGLGDAAIMSLLNSQIKEAIEVTGEEEFYIELPPNLIPPRVAENLEDPNLINQITLAGLELENGWITIGWNYTPTPTYSMNVVPGSGQGIPFDVPPAFDDITILDDDPGASPGEAKR